MNLDEIQQRSREIFRLEAADLLRELEEALLSLEADPANPSLLHRVFRVMHTLKGSGATSGFQELSDFVHRVEDVFNAARENRVAVTPQLIDSTLRIADAVGRYLAADPADAPKVLEHARADLDALLVVLPTETTGPKPGASGAPEPASSPAATGARTRYRIAFQPNTDVFRSGSDPGMFLDDLRALGECTVRGIPDSIPPLADMDPESNYLRWEIELSTDAGEGAIRDVFTFIEGECDLQIQPVNARSDRNGGPRPTRAWTISFAATERTLASPGVLEALWRDLKRFGALEILTEPASKEGRPTAGPRRVRLVTAEPAETIHSAFVFLLDAQPCISPEGEGSGEQMSLATVAHPLPEATRDVRARLSHKGENLRVSAERLDRLVNLVGELVILRSQVSTACESAINLPPELAGAAEALQSLSSEMRELVLNIRMMPVEQTFAKLRRLVRDLARDLGKDVSLAVEGGDTEMDKSVLDALADPLMHLVRNSLDHGLEPAAERMAAGKSAEGTLTLRAEQRGDRVMIVVRDDGRGLDSARIRSKAVSKGLIAADANPSEAELHQLIFLPGFSTADTVSQLSGRGVGLDVVRRQVEQLRGKVEVRSERGRSTEFRLSLPLTLAIIEGLMVEVDGDQYVLPLGIAREATILAAAARNAGNKRNMVSVRGELVPYVRLRDVFGFTSAPPDPERVVIVEMEDQRVGLVVDRVIGNHQTVLKSLGWAGRRVPLFSGATVLGSGHIALILDVPAILAHHQRARGTALALET